MTDRDLGRIWAKHFPRSKNGHVSEQICRLICLIIEKKLLLSLPGNSYEEKLSEILARCNIPAEEFASCRAVTTAIFPHAR